MKYTAQDITFISLFAALISVCSWLAVPIVIPFTLQLFAIFLSLLFLGGRRGIISILIYLLCGGIGLPVFSGFTGGFAVLLGPTGGFLIGFIFIGIIYLLFENKGMHIFSLFLGLLVCYFFGCIWFSHMGGVNIKDAFITCVLPFIIPDILKLLLANLLFTRIKKSIGS